MKNTLWITFLVFSFLTFTACSKTEAPPIPSAPTTTTGGSGNLWGSQFDGAVNYCAYNYTETYGWGGDWYEEFETYAKFCECYYKEIAKKVNYNDYFANESTYDSQYSSTFSSCEATVWPGSV